MAEKDPKKTGDEPEPAPKVEEPAKAPAIVRAVVERVVAPRHCIVDAVTKTHKFAGDKANVTADFADQHPECFV